MGTKRESLFCVRTGRRRAEEQHGGQCSHCGNTGGGQKDLRVGQTEGLA